MPDHHDMIVRRVIHALEETEDSDSLVWSYFDADREAVVQAAQQTLEATREDASRERVESAVDRELIEALRFPSNPPGGLLAKLYIRRAAVATIGISLTALLAAIATLLCEQTVINGKLPIGAFSLEFGSSQKRFDRLSAKVEKLTKRHEKLLEDEREIIEEMARLYLPELTPAAVSGALRQLQHDLRDVLAQQDTHATRLRERIVATGQRAEELTVSMLETELAEETAAAELDRARADVESTLGADSEHLGRATEHAAIMDRRAVLKWRRARLQGTANVERSGYEGFAPFAYLRKRNFGDPEYRAGFITRRLDGWLARRIGYETLERHYKVLHLGPHAIQAEIRRLTERASEIEREMDETEAHVGQQHGLFAALEEDAQAQRTIVEARQRLHEVTSERDAFAAELRAVQANRGAPYEEAVALHEDFLNDKTIRELERIARSTPDPRDEALVTRLGKARKEIEGSHVDLGAHRTELEKLATRTGSLADIAREAVHSFPSRRSYFPEEARLQDKVGLLLDEHSSTETLIDKLWEDHSARQIIVPASEALGGWFAELSSVFDPELGAVTVSVEDDVEFEHEIIVHDASGRVLHRRVTRRDPEPGGSNSR